MKSLGMIAAIALMGSPVVAQTAQQFDLACHGTSQTLTGAQVVWNDRIRVDLSANIYCWKNCTVRAQIDEVAEGVIWFSRAGDYTSVNRMTGEFEHLPGLIGREPKITGTCRVMPFTPITERAF